MIVKNCINRDTSRETLMNDQPHKNSDQKADAWAAAFIILALTAMTIFWVSQQSA